MAVYGLAVKRFVGSSPIASTFRCKSKFNCILPEEIKAATRGLVVT